MAAPQPTRRVSGGTEFKGTASVKAGSPRVCVDETFRLHRCIVPLAPFQLEEGEVAHSEFAAEGAVLEGGE